MLLPGIFHVLRLVKANRLFFNKLCKNHEILMEYRVVL